MFHNRTLSISVPWTINYTLELLIFQDSHVFYQSGFRVETWPEIYYWEDKYYSCYDSWLTVCVSFSGLCSTACRLTCALTGIVFASDCFLSLALIFPFVFLNYYYKYFISTMSCLPLLWSLWSTVFVFVLFETLYQSYHSIPSLTLRALLSAPPTRHWLAEMQVRPPFNLASPTIHSFKLVLKLPDAFIMAF